MGREPHVGQQLREPVDRMGRQSLEHILQVDERIAPEPIAAADDAIQDHCRPAAPVTPDDMDVPSTEGLSPQRPLGAVVVDAQLAVASRRMRHVGRSGSETRCRSWKRAGDGCHALFLGHLVWAPEETVKADAIWKNEAQPPASAALLLCNLNGQVKGAKESALDAGGFGRLEDRKTTDDAALIRQTLAPFGRRGSGCRSRLVRA